MIVLGLTGSIGMGKSEAGKAFRALGVPVFDSDGIVHDLFVRDRELVGMIDQEFPGCVIDGTVDRGRLGQCVFGDEEKLKKLEGFIHPRVAQAREAFIAAERAKDTPLVVFDVPLLFETGGNKYCDKVVVVSAPEAVQRPRVLSRTGMSEQKLDAILAKQMSDAEKRSKADYVISGADGLEQLAKDVHQLVSELTA